MKCPHCGVSVACHGHEIVKCWTCGRWMDALWVEPTKTTLGYYKAIVYARPKHGMRGGWDSRPSDVERLVELCREHGFRVPFRAWKFERLRPGYWQRSAGAWSWRITWTGGECGSPESVAWCLKRGAGADISS